MRILFQKANIERALAAKAKFLAPLHKFGRSANVTVPNTAPPAQSKQSRVGFESEAVARALNSPSRRQNAGQLRQNGEPCDRTSRRYAALHEESVCAVPAPAARFLRYLIATRKTGAQALKKLEN